MDVSDPEFLKSPCPSIDRVSEGYDHHVGFESYWSEEYRGQCTYCIPRRNSNSYISRVEKGGTGRKDAIRCPHLLIVAILDNTLNLTSSNTTDEDKEILCALYVHSGVGDEFRSTYFSEVQANVEANLKNAIFNDIKMVRNNAILPLKVAQLDVWDTEWIFENFPKYEVGLSVTVSQG